MPSASPVLLLVCLRQLWAELETTQLAPAAWIQDRHLTSKLTPTNLWKWKSEKSTKLPYFPPAAFGWSWVRSLHSWSWQPLGHEHRWPWPGHTLPWPAGTWEQQRGSSRHEG